MKEKINQTAGRLKQTVRAAGAGIATLAASFFMSAPAYAAGVQDSQIVKGTEQLIGDVTTWLKSYQRNAGHAMKRELEITIADMASGNEENALTRMESRIGSTMLSDVVRGLISVKRGDNGIMYFQMLSMTFKQLELQKLKLEAMKQPGKMRKYSFMLLGCFLLMYLGVLGYVVLEAFGDLF